MTGVRVGWAGPAQGEEEDTERKTETPFLQVKVFNACNPFIHKYIWTLEMEGF